MSSEGTKEPAATAPDAMPGNSMIPANIVASNTVRIYYALNDSMMKACRKDTDASNKEAEDTARTLLGYSDLPLLIRCHACMVLGCSIDSDFLYWAEEGVRVAELGCSLATKVGSVEEQLLHNCKGVFERAKKRYEEAGGAEGARLRAEEEEISDEEEEEVDDNRDRESAIVEEERKVVGDDGDVEMVDVAPKMTTRPSRRKKSNKVRRVHSGDTDGPWERYMEETGTWVRCAAPAPEQLAAAEVLSQTEQYDEMLLDDEGDEGDEGDEKFDPPAAEEGME